MNRKSNSGRWLKLLVYSTALALLGIVLLQAYWLRTSYVEQKNRFQADVENAIVATLIKSQISLEITGAEDSNLSALAPQLGEAIASILNKIPESVLKDTSHARHSITVKMTGDDSELEQYLSKYPQLKKSPDGIHLNLKDLSRKPTLREELNQRMELFREELKKRAITTPFDLALFDSTGRILIATSDTSAFRSIPVKSSLSDNTFNQDDERRRMQAAFPDANLYLLRRMAWLLSVSVLLMIICCVSFTALIRMFFRQKRLADIRNDFMNNMTHELKTPIASVSVALELMQDQRFPLSDEKKSEYFVIAQGELQRLSMLVEKVLKMAYFERGEIRISPEPILAAAWLTNILSSMRPVFEVANARVESRVQPELMLIQADKTHLTNVMQNLFENALKYNGNEEPRIQIDITEEDSFSVLRVTDNGRGIPANYSDRVFDKFFRVPTGDRHDTKGYGLGLSYVKAIAELHGGTVSVISVPNEHTTFTVRLPKKSS